MSDWVYLVTLNMYTKQFCAVIKSLHLTMLRLTLIIVPVCVTSSEVLIIVQFLGTLVTDIHWPVGSRNYHMTLSLYNFLVVLNNCRNSVCTSA